MTPELEQLVGNAVAFLLTLLVFSYILGDNPLYRIALHVFVGVAAGYVSVVVFQSVIAPRLFSGWLPAIQTAAANQTGPNDPLPLIRLIVLSLLSFLLLFKLNPRSAPVGNFVIAFVVGVGAAVAVGGAVTGTLFPQVTAAWVNPFASGDPADAINLPLIVLCTVLALMYFFYGGRSLPGGKVERPAWVRVLALGGQGVITVTLAALYVGALAASMALFVERIGFLYQFSLEMAKLFGFIPS
ncbi:MAG: hypothetical protein HYZ49_07970 [Chloroflexi bacterium]|nr:hypothetical protein [Chloroflexota bacterium]